MAAEGFGSREANLILLHVVKVNLSVGSIAAGAALIFVHLASAEGDSLLWTVPDEFKRLEVAPSLDVTLVAEGLRLGLTACAPEILLARDELYLEWGTLGYHWMRIWIQVSTVPHPRRHLDLELLECSQVLWLLVVRGESNALGNTGHHRCWSLLQEASEHHLFII